jgi:5-methylcytosine-specific restriction endonuclease McrA
METSKKEIQTSQPFCKACLHDGSIHILDIHHIVPVRFFDADRTLAVTDAHSTGNLIRLCRPCHSKAEFGKIVIKPKLDLIPQHKREAIQRLWGVFLNSLDDGTNQSDH